MFYIFIENAVPSEVVGQVGLNRTDVLVLQHPVERLYDYQNYTTIRLNLADFSNDYLNQIDLNREDNRLSETDWSDVFWTVAGRRSTINRLSTCRTAADWYVLFPKSDNSMCSTMLIDYQSTIDYSTIDYCDKED